MKMCEWESSEYWHKDPMLALITCLSCHSSAQATEQLLPQVDLAQYGREHGLKRLEI